MVRTRGVLAWVVGAVTVGQAAAADVKATVVETGNPAATTWALSATSELSYSSFSGARAFPLAAALNNYRGSGNQTYLETSYALSGNPNENVKLDLSLKSGLVSAEQTTFGFTGRHKGPTDTVVSGTFTYLGINGIQPYLSLNFNLPTGQSALFGFGGRSRLDPDLVPVPTFGEGFNVGPTIGANIPITLSLMLNLSGGVTWREAYNREGQIIAGLPILVQPFSKYKPGLLSSLSASLTYSDNAFTGQISAAFNGDTTAYLDNVATSRSGKRFTLGLLTSYGVTDALNVGFSGSASFANPNYGVPGDTAVPTSAIFPNGVAVFPNGVLLQEDSNSNSLALQGKLSLTYAFTPEFSLTPFAAVLYRDRNAYDPVLNLYTPAKSRYSAGASLRYALTDKIALTGRAEYIRTYERGTSDKYQALVAAFNGGDGYVPSSSTIALRYYGFQVAGGVNFSF